VTHEANFRDPDTQEFPKDLKEKLEAAGATIVTAAHAFGGVNKLIEDSVGNIIKKTLRMFCEGFKVAVEIAAMAANAGAIRTDEDVISIAGTGKGADTALVIRPANSANLFSIRVKKILSKPI
jgi:hypothetical protein